MSHDEYINSEVEYIGFIPKSWQIVRNKHIFKKTKVIVGQNWDKYNVLSLTKNGVIIKDIERNEGKMPSDFSIYQIINPDNLLMCLFDIDVTPRCVGYIENKGIVSAAYTELSAIDNIYMKYYYWWYLMLDIDKQLLHLSKNLRNSLSTEDFMALPVVKPPLDEQEQIANYLDKQTAKIDTTIAKNKELIQLLEEKRTALINQVVTKGLNPEVPMKDSGIEWIGEIPEHWEISRLKFLINKKAQYGANCEPEVDEIKFDYRYVRITDIDDNNSLKDNIVYLSKEDAKGFVLNEGDILFARSGATVGKTYLYNPHDGDCCFAGYLIRYIPNKQLLNPKYLLYFSFSKSYTEWIKIVSTQATIQNVSADKYDNLIISLPEVNEQNEIVSFLDNEIHNIDEIILKIKKKY